MVAIPIISGIGTNGADFTTSFPVNMVPVPKVTGISEGYLRPAEGIVEVATGPGLNRGGYRWRDVHYRVMGTSLVSISRDGVVLTIGTIAGDDWVTFAESFTYLAINGGGRLYLYNGGTLTQVTDPDLGSSLDVVWVNGYFVSTDGASLVSSDITAPFSFNPLRYASSEISPDPVVALHDLRNEIYAVNRYTIEIFGAIAAPGLNFPFERIEGAQIMRGAVGSRACCEFMASLAFLGSGRNEAPGVWVGTAGTSAKVSTREIDDILSQYPETELANAVLETRMGRAHEFLYIHLPDQTLVFDGAGSAASGQPIWFILRSGVPGGGYRARGMVWCYDRWNVADPFGLKIGYLDQTTSRHFGTTTAWEFATPIVYNDGLGAVIHEIELVAISGTIALEADPLIGTSYSVDGQVWSQPRYVRSGRNGQRAKRIVWDRQGTLSNWRVQRFMGDSNSHLAIARLEAQMEGLAT